MIVNSGEIFEKGGHGSALILFLDLPANDLALLLDQALQAGLPTCLGLPFRAVPNAIEHILVHNHFIQEGELVILLLGLLRQEALPPLSHGEGGLVADLLALQDARLG